MRRLAAAIALGQFLGCAQSTLPPKPADAQLTTPPPAATAPREILPAIRPQPEVAAPPEQPAPPLPDEQSNVFFAQGSTTLALSERAKLKQLAQRLRANPNLIVTLTGHTNDEGSRSFNLAIADRRLGVVSAFLKKSGGPARQIRRSIVAEEQANVACQSFACRKTLRRVEFVFEPAR